MEEILKYAMERKTRLDRRGFIGGSDARVIMSADETALIRLWREKRSEADLRICQAISSSNSASLQRPSIGLGSSEIQGAP
jgi:hypothetical protein